jgi:AAA ATPase domain
MRTAILIHPGTVRRAIRISLRDGVEWGVTYDFSMGLGGVAAGLLLERAAELGVITAAVGSAASGSGSALLVEGEAGIGKTSLLAYACEQAARAGITVRAARAAEFEGGYAWAVVRQLFAPEVAAGRRRAGDAAALAAPALGQGADRGGRIRSRFCTACTG